MYKIYLVLENEDKLICTCNTAEEKDEEIRRALSSSVDGERVFVRYEEVGEE